MNQKRVCIGLMLGVLVILIGFSVWLALTRIYQVDECQNIYMAHVLALGQTARFFTNGSLFLLGPLSWITKAAISSADMFIAARLLFLAVFWLNIFLLALIVGERLSSLRGLIALITAATLAPLWDYGFEIRHDNLILTGVLLIWWAARVKQMGILSYVLIGAATTTLLFVAVKTIVYVLPLSFAVLVCPPPDHKKRRWQLGLAWLVGALCALVVIRTCYGASKAWDIYLAVFHGVTVYSANKAGGSGGRFWPWITLSRLLWQTPLLLGTTTAACLAIIIDVVRRGKAAITWKGNLPEVLLLLGALGALLANPTPFPYNLVNVVPYAFILAFKYGAELWDELHDHTQLRPFFGTILIFAHLLPFSIATERHLNWPNFRQRTLMRLAENMTDPAKDPVYDAIGMVPTRPSIDFEWYLHSLNIQYFLHEKGHHVRDLLARRPAVVFIPSYRTDWLTEGDHEFIKERYVPLADDFWVLGKVLPAGGGAFEIIHSGRYWITSVQNSDPADTGSTNNTGKILSQKEEHLVGTLDGTPLSGQMVELNIGVHRIKTTNDCRPAIVWMGPRLDKFPKLSPGNHRTLFVNWY